MSEIIYKRAFIGDGYDDEWISEEFCFYMMFRPMTGRERAMFYWNCRRLDGGQIWEMENKVIAACVSQWAWAEYPGPDEQRDEREVTEAYAGGLDDKLRRGILNKILRRTPEEKEKEKAQLGNLEAGYDLWFNTRNSQPETAPSADDSSLTTQPEESSEEEMESPSLASQD